MKNRTLLTLLYASALLLLICSSLLPSNIRPYLSPFSLLLPLLVGLLLFRKRCGGRIIAFEEKSRKRTIICYLLFPIILLGIIAVSALSTFLFSLIGIESTTTLSYPLPTALIFYAAVPALLEEALYRYLPMLALQDESRTSVLVFSSVAFALAHLSLISLPYALFAGVGLFLVNLIGKGPLPSFLLHLTNNVLGVLLLFYPESTALLVGIVVALASLSVVCAVLLLKRKDELVDFWHELRADEPTPLLTPDLITFAVVTLFLSLIQL